MSPNPLDAHWKSFKALQNDYTSKSIVLGVDRTFARKWALVRGDGCPLGAQVTVVLLLLLVGLFLAGGAISIMHAQYVIAGLLAVAAFVDWRLMMNLAVNFARTAAVNDERLFRTWFRQRRVSVLKKSTGEYVWYNIPDEHGD